MEGSTLKEKGFLLEVWNQGDKRGDLLTMYNGLERGEVGKYVGMFHSVVEPYRDDDCPEMCRNSGRTKEFIYMGKMGSAVRSYVPVRGCVLGQSTSIGVSDH